MTTITLPRATVEQALEALEGSAGILQHEHVWPGAEKKSRFVIAALRAALAQQDEPTLTIERLRDALVASRIIPPAAVEAMWFADEITALRAALAQQDEPVEPVAHFGSAYVNENGVHITTVLGPVAIPQDAKLYTAPPQRTMVPLTEEEILAAVGWERAAMYMKLTPNFPVDEAKKETLTNARAVEKAVWEKNHG